MPRSVGWYGWSRTSWWCLSRSASSVRRNSAGWPLPERTCRMRSFTLLTGGSCVSRPLLRLRYGRVGGLRPMGRGRLPGLVRDRLHFDASLLGHAARRRKTLQPVHGGPHHVVRVGGAEALGEDVAHASALQHRTHRPPRAQPLTPAPTPLHTPPPPPSPPRADLPAAPTRASPPPPPPPPPPLLRARLPPLPQFHHHHAAPGPARHRSPEARGEGVTLWLPVREAPAPSAALDRSPSELQPPFAGAVGNRLHTPVVLVAAPVEHDPDDALLLRLDCDQVPQGEALARFPLCLGLDALGPVGGTDQGHAPRVVHQLRIDVFGGPKHDQPRSLRRAGDFLPDAEVTAVSAGYLSLDLMKRAHGLFGRRLSGFARLAAHLLAHIADPLPLSRPSLPHIA